MSESNTPETTLSDDEIAKTDPDLCRHGWSSLHPQPCPECENETPRSNTTEERYFVSDEVEHDCCADATVRDRRDTDGLGGYGKHPSIVCECADIEMAERIARLLNEECARAGR